MITITTPTPRLRVIGSRAGRRKKRTMTFPELFRLPATVDMATAASALGMHVNTAYKLAKDGAFPCAFLRPGWCYRIPTMALLRALHIEEIPVSVDDVEMGVDSSAGRRVA